MKDFINYEGWKLARKAFTSYVLIVKVKILQVQMTFTIY